MKKTDFAPRTAPFEFHVNKLYPWETDLIGVEIGVDVGAHAESMLTHLSIKKLYLVDIWDKDYYRGYCEGRLASKFYSKFEMVQEDSLKASESFEDEFFHFIYIDQRPDYNSVYEDLMAWWPKLKRNGVLGYRNYSKTANPHLCQAVDDFCKHEEQLNKISSQKTEEPGEIIIVKK